MRQCAFCILPSCSEGQSQSVLEAMNQGLVPLVSRMAGVDMGNFGFYIEPVSIEMIRWLSLALSKMSHDEWLQRSRQARAAIAEAYSEQHFRKNLMKALYQIIPPDELLFKPQ